MRLIWWGFLGLAIVLSSASWLLWRAPMLRTYGNVVLIVAYGSIGAAIYALRRPDPFPRVFGYHEVFHALAIIAAAVQYAAVMGVVAEL